MKFRSVYVLFGVVTLAGALVYGYPDAEDMDEDGDMDDMDDMEGMEDMEGMGGMEGMEDMMAKIEHVGGDDEGDSLPAAERKTLPYVAPSEPASYLVYDTFQSSGNWMISHNDKYKGDLKFTLRKNPALIGDMGMKISSDSQHHRAALKMKAPMSSNEGKTLYAAYEVEFEENVQCGGQYVKLFNSKDADLESFSEATPYSIMFGPDRCGVTNKVHLIVKFQNPKTGEWQEAHLKKSIPTRSGSDAHSYGFAIHSNDSYTVYIDGEVTASGDMKTDFTPSFGNEKKIIDVNDKQPANWVTEKQIPDPNAVKPEDWNDDAPEFIIDTSATMPEGWLVDEPQLVRNPTAVMPEDWNQAEDGAWEAPMMKNPKCNIGCGPWVQPEIKNPEYKGKWKPTMIDNPEYKGDWKAREIDNPDYFVLEHPHAVAPFDSVGLEIWTVQAGAILDNLIITHDETSFTKFIEDTYKVKAELHKVNKVADQKAKEKTERKLSDPKSGVLSGYGVPVALALVIAVIGVVFMKLKNRGSCCPVDASKKTDEVTADKGETETEKKDSKAETKTAEKSTAKESTTDETAPEIRRRKASQTIEAK